MNRGSLAFVFFLCMVTLPTHAANWVFVWTNNSGDEFFIDKSSLQRDGDSVTSWTKINFAERTKGGALSAKVQETVNCRRREKIIRYLITYDDKDNRGRVISSFDPKDPWDPMPPDTFLWEMMLFVCRK